jgi:hypothetical protein
MAKTAKKPRENKEKTKRITVKFFLNKALQPIEINNKKAYPLYMLVTYNRKNTMLKPHYGYYYRDLKEVSTHAGFSMPGVMAFEEKIVRKTIAYEIAKAGSEFTLKGIHKKYDVYCLGIHSLLERHLKKTLNNASMRTEPHEFNEALNFGPRISFETLYTICKKIYTDLDKALPKGFDEEVKMYDDFLKLYGAPFFDYNFPTVIEWLDESIKEDYRKKLSVIHRDNKKMIDKAIDFVDRIIQYQIGNSN